MDLLYSEILERENDNLYVFAQRIEIDQMIKKSNLQDAFILLVRTLSYIKTKIVKNNLIIEYNDFIRDFIFNNLEYKL
jgi:hypothetical protein